MKFFRKSIFWLHLGVGASAGLVILLLATTGLILAFQRQIVSWSDASAVRDGGPHASTPLSLDSVLTQLVQQGQNGPTELVLHRSQNAPFEARYVADIEKLLAENVHASGN
jgi:uncharacterized iron-regulated membrane protein